MDDNVLCAMRALEERVTELESRVSSYHGTGVLGEFNPLEPDNPEGVEAVFLDPDDYEPEQDSNRVWTRDDFIDCDPDFPG